MNLMWIIVFFLAILFVLIRHLLYVRKINKLPGFPATFGLVGKLFHLIRVVREVGSVGILIEQFFNAFCLMDLSQTGSSGIFSVWLGPKPLILIYCPEFIGKILMLKYDAPKGPSERRMTDWMGEGLIMSDGHKWNIRRKMFSPAFTPRSLGSKIAIVEDKTNILLDMLQKDAASNSENIVYDLSNHVSQFTLASVTEFVLGEKVPIPCEEARQFTEAVDFVHQSYYTRVLLLSLEPLFKWTPEGRVYQQKLKFMHDFTLNLIHQRLRNFTKNSMNEETNEMNAANNNISDPKLIDILLTAHLKSPSEFTLQDVQDEVNASVIAGFDAGWSFLNGTIYLLGSNIDVQRTMQNELDAFFDQREDSDDPLTIEDLRSLTYTEAVIKEAHRLWSTVGMIARTLKDDTSLGEHIIPAGTEVIIPFCSIHNSPKYWPNPSKFDPTRFLDANPAAHPYAYIPFSAGHRNCMGQKFAFLQMKLSIAKIFHRFNVDSLDPMYTIPIQLIISKRFTKPIRVKLTARTNKENQCLSRETNVA